MVTVTPTVEHSGPLGVSQALNCLIEGPRHCLRSTGTLRCLPTIGADFQENF